MEQHLKQRLIGATILISLAVIFVPMLIGTDRSQPNSISIEIPKPPAELDSKILALPEQDSEVLAQVSVSKESGVNVTQTSVPSIPSAPVSTAVAVEGITAWVVQVGSFSEQKNADALSNRLMKAGFVAFVEQVDGKSGEIYRVRVGPELSKEKADVLAIELKQQHQLSSAIVVQYP
ncbi:MAG: SPOR domain-containing protein [Cycloclasticus sp.]|nr:SPOR domain-containing protein [Cycloclasticus sp.]MBQ0789277.1 SPOR domain-containing protein [Cycloclasticus sp.]